MKDKIMIEVEPTKESVMQVAAFVEEQMEKLCVPVKMMMKLMVVLDEIYSNIVNYSEARFVRISIWRQDDNMCLEFEDDGKQYNPLEAEEPDITMSAEERSIGGLGIFMVKKMMDKVEYEYKDGKNRLLLQKSISE